MQIGPPFRSPAARVDATNGMRSGRRRARPALVFVSTARSAIVQDHGIVGAPDLVAELWILRLRLPKAKPQDPVLTHRPL